MITVAGFIVPFWFMFVNSLKDHKETYLMNIVRPSPLHWGNYAEIFGTNDDMLLTALKNSLIITAFSVAILILSYVMAGYVRLKAKRLMKENPRFYIKDIAEMVGYQDQFYFSRVFRSYVGKSPSEYMNEQECGGGCPAV